MIRITTVTGTELYHRYPGQSAAQPVHVKLDCRGDGTLSASHSPEIGNAVPFAVYHGHVRQWGIPALQAGAADTLLAEIAPLAERVVAGYSAGWDGNNTVADFTADAERAIEEISELCEASRGSDDDRVVVWEAGDYYGAVGSYTAQCRELGITATTTDDELDSIEVREDGKAAAERIHEIEGHAKHLRYLRDWARSAEEA